MKRKRGETEWYDVMQACENGHIITSRTKSDADDMKKRCPKCGAKTIMACPKCSAEIPGYHHIPHVHYSGPSEPPAHCHECGEPYPWTKKSEVTVNTATRETTAQSQSNKVFVVHGHDEEMKQHVARTLTQIGLSPVILHEQPNSGKTIIEKFETNADVSFAVVLLSPDEMAFPAEMDAKSAKPRARQNVVLELGYFIGKLGRKHVFALKRDENLELPSDISGVVYTAYDTAGHWRFELVRELKAVGYGVDANQLL